MITSNKCKKTTIIRLCSVHRLEQERSPSIMKRMYGTFSFHAVWANIIWALLLEQQIQAASLEIFLIPSEFVFEQGFSLYIKSIKTCRVLTSPFCF